MEWIGRKRTILHLKSDDSEIQYDQNYVNFNVKVPICLVAPAPPALELLVDGVPQTVVGELYNSINGNILAEYFLDLCPHHCLYKGETWGCSPNNLPCQDWKPCARGSGEYQHQHHQQHSKLLIKNTKSVLTMTFIISRSPLLVRLQPQ